MTRPERPPAVDRRALALIGLPLLRVLPFLMAYAALGLESALVIGASPAGDAHAYWVATLDQPYLHSVADTHDAYLYSPAFLQVLTPLRALPFEWFWAAWVLGSVAILLWLVGPVLGALFMFPSDFNPVFLGVWYGNIHLPIALVLALGMSYPALWSFMLLTKVTPGIGLLWFAARGKWRQLALALGVTAAIVTVSYLLSPASWQEWIGVLAANATAAPHEDLSLPPLAYRLIVAAAVVVSAARRNDPRPLPFAIIIAAPLFWFQSLTLLLVLVWQARATRGWRALLPALPT